MKTLLLELVLILLLIVANGFFSMAEMAIVSSRRARLYHLQAFGSALKRRRAKVALELAESPERFLSTVQIGITLIGILAGTLGGATLAGELALLLQRIGENSTTRLLTWLPAYSEMLGVGIVVIGITYLSLIIGELVPKRLALNAPERIATQVASSMRALSRAAGPLVHVLEQSTAGILRLFRIQLQDSPPITEEEVKILIEQGTQSGVFNAVEQSLVRNIFRLADQPVSTLMTPRMEMIWLDVERPLDELRRRVIESPHTLFPVGRGSVDDFLGVVKGKELLAAMELPRSSGEASQPSLSFDWSLLLQEPPLLLETRSALDALEAFRFSSLQMALVIDTNQSIEGLVTSEDLLHAIVSDTVSRSQPPFATQVSGEKTKEEPWMLEGTISLLQLKEIFPLGPLPGEERGFFTTLSGFLMSRLGRVPTVGDIVEWGGFRFEVAAMQGRRAARVAVTPPPPAPQETGRGALPAAPLPLHSDGPSPPLKQGRYQTAPDEPSDRS